MFHYNFDDVGTFVYIFQLLLFHVARNASECFIVF
jgi:hypothetical protein